MTTKRQHRQGQGQGQQRQWKQQQKQDIDDNDNNDNEKNNNNDNNIKFYFSGSDLLIDVKQRMREPWDVLTNSKPRLEASFLNKTVKLNCL